MNSQWFIFFFSFFFFLVKLQVVGHQHKSPKSCFEEVNIPLLSQASKHSMSEKLTWNLNCHFLEKQSILNIWNCSLSMLQYIILEFSILDHIYYMYVGLWIDRYLHTIWHYKDVFEHPLVLLFFNALTWPCSAGQSKLPVVGLKRKPPEPWSPRKALHPPHPTAAGPLLASGTYKQCPDTPALTGSCRR